MEDQKIAERFSLDAIVLELMRLRQRLTDISIKLAALLVLAHLIVIILPHVVRSKVTYQTAWCVEMVTAAVGSENNPPKSMWAFQPIPHNVQPGTNWVVLADFKGPARVSVSESLQIQLSLWITNASMPFNSDAKIIPSDKYIASIHFQAPNFDFDQDTKDIKNQLFEQHIPLNCAWLLAPKEKRFGVQYAQANVYFQNKQRAGKVPRIPPIMCIIHVTDPLGLPAPVIYVAVPFVGIVIPMVAAWIIKRLGRNKPRDITRPPPPLPQTDVENPS